MPEQLIQVMTREFCMLLCAHIHAQIQSTLLDLGSHVAPPRSTPSDARLARTQFADSVTEQLERWIDAYDEQLPPLRNFVLPVCLQSDLKRR